MNFIVQARVHAAFLATCGNQASVLYCIHMNTTTFSVRVGRSTKSRLEKLAKSCVYRKPYLRWWDDRIA